MTGIAVEEPRARPDHRSPDGDLVRTQSGCFDDVAGTRHEPAVCALADLDIVDGVDADSYGPGRPITRAQTASLVWRASL